jgi:Ca2+/Na+ antiporter
MNGWLRHLELNARARLGVDSQVLIWAVVAVLASLAAVVFLVIAAFIWLTNRYDALTAGLVLGGVFVAIAIIAIVACLVRRRRNRERARLELAARSRNAAWLDPRLIAVGFQVGRAVGWRKLAALAAVGLLAAGLAQEWRNHDQAPADDDVP